jgi:hypothetical protein
MTGIAAGSLVMKLPASSRDIATTTFATLLALRCKRVDPGERGNLLQVAGI